MGEAAGGIETGRRTRVLTGYRPTGPLHVGHWFGNIRSMLELQQEHDPFFFIADWHSLTTDYDRTDALPDNVHGLVLDWLAAGYDERRARERGKLEQMTVYGQTALCRTRLLLDALGDEDAETSCDHCDNCLGQAERAVAAAEGAA